MKQPRMSYKISSAKERALKTKLKSMTPYELASYKMNKEEKAVMESALEKKLKKDVEQGHIATKEVKKEKTLAQEKADLIKHFDDITTSDLQGSVSYLATKHGVDEDELLEEINEKGYNRLEKTKEKKELDSFKKPKEEKEIKANYFNGHPYHLKQDKEGDWNVYISGKLQKDAWKTKEEADEYAKEKIRLTNVIYTYPSK